MSEVVDKNKSWQFNERDMEGTFSSGKEGGNIIIIIIEKAFSGISLS